MKEFSVPVSHAGEAFRYDRCKLGDITFEHLIKFIICPCTDTAINGLMNYRMVSDMGVNCSELWLNDALERTIQHVLLEVDIGGEHHIDKEN